MLEFICATCGQFSIESDACSLCESAPSEDLVA